MACVCVPFGRWLGKKKYWRFFERGMVVSRGATLIWHIYFYIQSDKHPTARRHPHGPKAHLCPVLYHIPIIKLGGTKMVVGAKCTGLNVSRTAMLLGFSCSTVSHVYQEWSTTERTSSQLDTTVGSIGVNMGQHPFGRLLTPCRVHAPMNWGCSEGKRGCNSILGRCLWCFVEQTSVLGYVISKSALTLLLFQVYTDLKNDLSRIHMMEIRRSDGEL